MKKIIRLFLIIFLISGCKQTASDVVEVFTDTILRKVTIQISTNQDLGEMSVGSLDREIQVQIKNNSSDPIRKIVLEIGTGQSVLKFKPDADFMSLSPGFGGDCAETLDPGATCKFVLEFSTRKPGEFSIPVTVKYENTLEPQSEVFNFKALIGEPASLVFTNDQVLYDFGVIEQTDPTPTDLTLEIQNVGGLSAKASTLTFLNSSGAAFTVKSNSCPTDILPMEKCTVVVSYRPYNNNYTDPEAKYSAKLTLSYTKDPEGGLGKLNGTFKFTASTIEAKFATNYAPIMFDTLIAGNKQTKTIKVTNSGYKEGIIKSIVVNNFGLPFATCSKGVDKILNCQKSLSDLPFVIEDLNNCFENPVAGVVGKLAGQSCYFNVTYWPSVEYAPASQLIHDFNSATLTLVYDSQWKNQENMVSKLDLFDIDAGFVSNARMDLTSIQVESTILSGGDIVSTTPGVFEANLGRLAKISDASYKTYVKITFTNNGESNASLVSMMDGASTPHEIGESTIDFNSYYGAVKYNTCATVAPGGVCVLSFNLTPLALGDTATEDALMYDNIENALKKYKQFNLTYQNGASFNDDGAAASNHTTSAKLISKLIAKGMLVFVDPLTQTFPTIVNGTTSNHTIRLKNVGTGNIYAISHHPTSNLFPKNSTWQYEMYDLPTLTLPATKDCFEILYAPNTPVVSTDTPDTARFLAPGEVCALGVKNAAPDVLRETASLYPTFTSEYNRFFSESLVGSTEMWKRYHSTNAAKKLLFHFYDGDVDPDNAASAPFGLKQITSEMSISSDFRSPAYVIFKDPEPIQSGILYRPAFSYPVINQNYPTVSSLTAYDVPEAYFDLTTDTTVNSTFTAAKNSKNYFSTLPGPHTTYTYHMGTFKVGEVFVGSLNLFNTGGSTASSLTIVEEAVVSPISLTKLGNLSSPFPAISMSSSQKIKMEFTFTPSAAGVHKRCYAINYYNQIGAYVDQEVCVMATAVDTIPTIEFKVQDINVSYNAGTDTVTETPSGIWTTFTPVINNYIDPAATFSAIRQDKSYALKLFRITNTGDATATKFSFSTLTGLNVPGTLIPEVTTLSSTSAHPTCTLNMTLAAGASCEIYIKYKPLTTSQDTYAPFVGVVYERRSNQFVTQSLGLRFTAISPANLVAQSLVLESVTSWKNPSIPLPVSASYPLNLNEFSKTNTHLIANDSSSSRVFTVVVNNTATLKASFLLLNPNPSASAWNEIYNNNESILVEANRGCFYGDDEFSAVPADEKGFNSTTVNKCNLRVTFTGRLTYATCSAWNAATKTKVVKFGGKIIATCNPYTFELPYWSYQRSASKIISFHVRGFIEPNKTLASGSLTNVQAYSISSTKGAVSFTVPTLEPLDPGYGGVTKYKVFYSTVFDNLYNQNMFYNYTASPVMTSVETTNPNITISNLTKGLYYFFKVVALRDYVDGTYGTLSYVSLSNIPILTLPIPDQTMFYWHDQKALIDKTFQNTPGTLSQATTKCQGLKYLYNIKGVNTYFAKSLINSTHWGKIISDSTNSTGYPVNDPGSVPHWLSDATVNIGMNISLYDNTIIPGFPDYDPLQLSAGSADYKVMYQKACNNVASCEMLNKVVGGDDVDLFYQGTLYTHPTGTQAYPRCYSVIRCPTNTSKAITDGTCANP